jgi:hypothetical protein
MALALLGASLLIVSCGDDQGIHAATGGSLSQPADGEVPSISVADPSYGSATEVVGVPPTQPDPAPPGTLVVAEVPGGAIAYSYTPAGEQPRPYRGFISGMDLEVSVGTAIEFRLRFETYDRAASSDPTVAAAESSTESDGIRVDRFRAVRSGRSELKAGAVQYPGCSSPPAPYSCDPVTLELQVTLT